MFKTLANIFRVPELRNKVLFTLFLLAIYRIGFHIPIPGVDQDQFAEMADPGHKKIKESELTISRLQNEIKATSDPVLASTKQQELNQAQADLKSEKQKQEEQRK